MLIFKALYCFCLALLCFRGLFRRLLQKIKSFQYKYSCFSPNVFLLQLILIKKKYRYIYTGESGNNWLLPELSSDVFCKRLPADRVEQLTKTSVIFPTSSVLVQTCIKNERALVKLMQHTVGKIMKTLFWQTLDCCKHPSLPYSKKAITVLFSVLLYLKEKHTHFLLFFFPLHFLVT